ncbi:hypothetical protein [Agrobacterium tumefaciens]|uniref:Uncharacterized protein n=1 Tax=Agrobacterium tumefaciens TaxID=358 RepID=A0A1B9UA11_AGRTU|nr:hypothetical protein [Agrobacterium tumefaciens]NSL22626.1 hypothetical protein [Agrobacterium tumefaciens]NTB84341.1 hypothetical protein [Agrobacterium tumefaciens]NTC18040.1 hypothetical protein [Agrobacterium tumefaciens]NTC27167.1 hypothetical protein [Agrobacterium tumefaciens]NTC56987.1 hypothetical protein [Agrobacterium tumefaciens]
MNTENMQVVNALVGRPVLWDGGLGNPDTKVLTLLRKRSIPAAPMILSRLTGYGRHEVNEVLLRLKRRGLAKAVGHGEWVAVQ